MTFTEWLVSTFGTAVVLSALVAAFWKVILNHITASVKHKYDKELETHINDLRHKSELALKDVELRASEYNIKLKTVFEEQAKVIVTLYGKLLPMLDAAENYTLLMQDSDPQKRLDQIKTFSEKCNDYYDYFRPNRIYLPQTTSKQANELAGTIVKLVNKYHKAEKLLKLQPLNEAGQESINRLDEQVDAMQARIEPLLQTLEIEFQKVLGFATPDKGEAAK